jgi:hypothetical protein
MQTIETTNGVNVEQLVETIEAIREQPEIADFRFRVTNRWVDGGQKKRRSVASSERARR